jgi:ATP-dependent helicase/DNAse subunit B
MPVRIFSCSANLPALIAEELAQKADRDFSCLAIVVPSRRLGNYVRRALAERVTACVPPRICTLDELAGMIPSPHRRQRISKTEQVLVLADLLRPGRFQHFCRGMEDDIARFFDELAAEDLLPDVFERIRELLLSDEFKDERHLERLLQQANELESLQNDHENFLEQNGLIDASRDLAVRVKSLANSSLLALRSTLHEIYLLGFVDATRIQQIFIKKILQGNGAHLWTHAEPSFLIEETQPANEWFRRVNLFLPLIELLKAVGEKSQASFDSGKNIYSPNENILSAAYTLPSQSSRLDDISQPTPIHLHEAATPLAEVKAAAALIRKLVHQQSIPPHRIAVIVPDEQIYGRLAWSVFAEADIEANNSLGQELLRTRVGQWLHLLLTLVQENWRLPDLISFLHHPLSELWMRATSPQVNPADAQNVIERCLIHDEIAHGQERIFQAIGASKDGEPFARRTAEDFLVKIKKALEPFSDGNELVLAEWAEKFFQFLQEIQLERWTVLTGGGAYNLDGQALRLTVSTLQEMQRIGSFLQQPLRFGDFFRLLNQSVFAATVRPVGEPYSDVQVMGLLESRSIPATVFIVLGNNEGSFPTALARELFLEEPLRAKLGLTTYRKRELLQDMNFFQLAAGASEVHLFYSRLHDDAPRVRSRFIERLFLLNAVTPGAVQMHQESGNLFESDFLLDDRVRKANANLKRRHNLVGSRMKTRYDQRGAFSGDRAKLLANFSATTLRMLFHCPYRFLLNANRIDELELPSDEADSRLLGDWLHGVFQLFFQGVDPAIPLSPENEDLRQAWTKAITSQDREVALDRLQRLGRLLMTPHEGQEHLFYHMLYVGWPAFIEKEIERGTGVFQPEYFEFVIENALKNLLLVGAHVVGVRGRVDRIFVTENEIRLIDYKLSGFHGSEKSILEADEPQLPLYALALQKTGLFSSSAKWFGEYWSIRRGESKDVLEKEDDGLAAGFENMLNRWQSRLDQLSSGAPFDADETKYCQECLYAGVCRREELFYRERDKL